MRRDRRDEAFNRWEVPLADLNGRLSVPEAVALSPPGGRWPRTASRLDGTPRHLRPWNWPTWRYSRPAAAAISASHGKPPDDPFRQAGTERAEALLPLLHQAIQDGSSGGRDCEAKIGRCQLHRGGKGGWTLPARDARNGGCHSLAAWGKTLARQHQLHPNAEYLVVNHVDRRCLTKTPWEAVTVAFLRIGYGSSPRWPR
jgi:hypothetical protein